MQQAWRDAFAEVDYRNSQAMLAAPDPVCTRLGGSTKSAMNSTKAKKHTPRRGGRNAKAQQEERTSRRSAHMALYYELPHTLPGTAWAGWKSKSRKQS